jgi:hypothetical protein
LDSIRFEMELMLPTGDPARDEAGALQCREVLGDLSRRLGERSRERGYGLVASLAETREQPSPCRVTEREKDFVELCLARAQPGPLPRMSCAPAASFFLYTIWCIVGQTL